MASELRHRTYFKIYLLLCLAPKIEDKHSLVFFFFRICDLKIILEKAFLDYH